MEEGGETHFKKVELIRIPMRLGEDAFITGKISEKKATDSYIKMQDY